MVVDQAVELALASGRPTPTIRALVVRVTEAEVVLRVTDPEGLPAEVVPGTRLRIRFTHAGAGHEGLSTVCRGAAAGAERSLAIAPIVATRVVERREFFRLHASLAASVYVLEAPGYRIGNDDRRASCTDFSAGGAGVETALVVGAGQPLWFALEVPRGLRQSFADEICCAAAVVWSRPVGRGERIVTAAGLRLAPTREAERDQWVRLSLELQRRLRAAT